MRCVLGPDVWEVAYGWLHQGALVYVSRLLPEYVRTHVDVIWLLADIVEPVPCPELLLHTPIDDNANGCDRLEEMRAVAHTLKGKRVLTVCHMGENRSGLASALLLMEHGYSPHQAVGTVWAHVRPNTRDQDHALWNPGFVRQLLG